MQRRSNQRIGWYRQQKLVFVPRQGRVLFHGRSRQYKSGTSCGRTGIQGFLTTCCGAYDWNHSRYQDDSTGSNHRRRLRCTEAPSSSLHLRQAWLQPIDPQAALDQGVAATQKRKARKVSIAGQKLGNAMLTATSGDAGVMHRASSNAGRPEHVREGWPKIKALFQYG